MIKNGIVAGKFRLLHLAHKALFLKASEICNHLHIVVCDDPQSIRYSSIEDLCKAIEDILKGTSYSLYIAPESAYVSLNQWENWLKEHVVACNDLRDYTIFNSKEDYINHEFQNCYLELGNMHAISASSIEKTMNIHNHQNIAREFKPFMAKKIVISGTESCGKSIMTKKLAAYFQGSTYSSEYGRYFCAKYLHNDDALFKPAYFKMIVQGQLKQDQKMLMESNSLTFFVDTDPIVTYRFLLSYAEKFKFKPEDLKETLVFIKNEIKNYKADVTIILSPDTPYVQDGTRWEQTQADRSKNHALLLDLYKEFNIPYTIVNQQTYENRLAQAIKIIEEQCKYAT